MRRTNLTLNQPASAFPVACYGVSERNKIGIIPYWEDSPQLAAGYASMITKYSTTQSRSSGIYETVNIGWLNPTIWVKFPKIINPG